MTALISIGVTVAGIGFALWRARRGGLIDYRTRNDRAMARRYTTYRPTPEVQQPGRDDDLLFDALIAYYGPPGLNRLHNAITQTRKETQ